MNKQLLHFIQPQRIINQLASLKLAVVLIISLAIISAWGTIVESQTDARTAQKLVYQSIYMYVAMIVLCINLIAVIIHRYPWRIKHVGFISAHVGIILTLVGAYLTQKYGVDGSMSLIQGQKERYVNIADREISIYSYYNGVTPELVKKIPVDFLTHRPRPDRPQVIAMEDSTAKIINFYPYAFRKERIIKSDRVADGPAVRFQLSNQRVSFSKWIQIMSFTKSETIELGPAKVILTQQPFEYKGGNVIVLRPEKGKQPGVIAKNKKFFNYWIYSNRRKGLIKKGRAVAGDVILTGWMDLKLRIINYYPHATNKVTFTSIDRPTPLSIAAIQVQFKENKFWVGLNSFYRLFDKNKGYVFVYGNKKIHLNFDIELQKFKQTFYQGTQKARSYESHVLIHDPVQQKQKSTTQSFESGTQVISMNNPLKYDSFTFYQSSFNKDEQGQVTASILSVNWDPGRPLKYIGSALIVLGIIHLFYFKRRKRNKILN